MFLRTVCRCSLQPAALAEWYHGVVVRFSADAQTGMVRLLHRVEADVRPDSAAHGMSSNCHGDSASLEPGDGTKRAENLTAGCAANGPSQRGSGSDQTLAFSSRAAFLTDVFSPATCERASETASLHPCFIAGGYPVLVQVHTMQSGASVRRVVIHSQGQNVAAPRPPQLMVRCFPKAAFAQWQTFRADAHDEAVQSATKASTGAGAACCVGVDAVDEAVLEMIGLPLSRLLAGSAARNTAAGWVDEASAWESVPGPGRLDGVDAIFM